MKFLDAKLAPIRATPSSRAFILADAKDAGLVLWAEDLRPAQTWVAGICTYEKATR